ncbi:MAG TPA: hypothetical protein DIC56_08440 [Rhizobium sp.]|nr:hypothetical protein [Rhizobium sp.]
MFFTQAARIVAILVFLFGVLQIVLGFGSASGILEPAPLPKWAPSRQPTGEVIDNGIYMVVFALALGTLAEIGLAVKRLRDTGAPHG